MIKDIDSNNFLHNLDDMDVSIGNKLGWNLYGKIYLVMTDNWVELIMITYDYNR